MFRQVSEEQRRVSEGRYRSVLLDAVQDAVYLAAQNQQLQADNKRLRKGQLISRRLNNCRELDTFNNLSSVIFQYLEE